MQFETREEAIRWKTLWLALKFETHFFSKPKFQLFSFIWKAQVSYMNFSFSEIIVYQFFEKMDFLPSTPNVFIHTLKKKKIYQLTVT